MASRPGAMTIYEPATLGTDLLLAAVAAGLAIRLHRRIAPANFPARCWVWALALTAGSAVIGGAYHGFAPNFAPAVEQLWWRLTLWSITLVSAAMAAGWVGAVVPSPWRKVSLWLVAGKSVAFATVSAHDPDFAIAIIDYGSSLVFWLGAALGLRRAWSGWMIAAIGLCVGAALVQQLQLAPAPWFNHNDLYHVIQALGLVAFYRAALRFGSVA